MKIDLSGMTPRELKMWGVAALLGVAVIALAAFLVAPSDGGPQPVRNEGGIVTYDSGHVLFNATQMTESRAELRSNHEVEYRGDPVWANFQMTGINLNRTFIVQERRGDELLYEFRPVFHPSDGVPQAFILPVYREAENGFAAEVYIDREFRDHFDRVNVAVGPPTEPRDVRAFDGEEVQSGIYRDTVEPRQYVLTNYWQRMWMVGNFTDRVTRNATIGDYVALMVS